MTPIIALKYGAETLRRNIRKIAPIMAGAIAIRTSNNGHIIIVIILIPNVTIQGTRHLVEGTLEPIVGSHFMQPIRSREYVRLISILGASG